MAFGSFNGLRVLALENRRAAEIEKLIRTYGGEPVVASALREIPLESNHEALEFAGRLLHGEFDLIIFMTGVGVRRLMEIVSSRYDRARIIESLRHVKLATRGPKSSAAVREMGLPVAVTAPEPCTWREMIDALDGAFGPSLEGLRAAVQEYGTPNPELLEALTRHHVQYTRVPVYQWALPDDLEPLRNSIRSIIAGQLDVIIFLTAIQVSHLFRVAEQMNAADALREGMRRTVVLSIGPSTSEELARHGVEPDFEPSHPKMGFLMNEASELAAKLLEEKRGPAPHSAVLARLDTAAQGSRPALVPSPRAASPAPAPAAPRDTEAAQPPDTRHLSAIQLVHDIGRRMASSDPLHAVLSQIVGFIETLLSCDSCFIYVLEENQLVLRGSKNPHPDVIDHLGLKIGQGITGWVAEHREPVSIDSGALRDPRFQSFQDLPEDSFEAFLSVPILARGGLVGVINVQHRQPHHYTPWEVQTVSTVGFLVGAEIEMARLESEKNALSGQLESRKLVERAKGLLQRDHNIKEEDAYRMMQKESRQRRKSMREIAEAVILSDELRRAAAVKPS
ncbi:uroporphyrinogen-III synthase [Paracidobacterium acidisoli]|uniref:ANTAR domain-containing protein n=1 Tax=Paracidobacterium acidisoli TaxID=2303751 RepID=A0A372IUM6_9BACT|nr:uroporphyrinogen-III synthase [Paracidobacterium acidisoli]MBT9330090.1 uroporphyrinogen-III synthase [Paracidobacterium acidisoli]